MDICQGCSVVFVLCSMRVFLVFQAHKNPVLAHPNESQPICYPGLTSSTRDDIIKQQELIIQMRYPNVT